MAGVDKGVRVGLLLPNTHFFVVAYYGALKAGATVVNLNQLYAEAEIRQMFVILAKKLGSKLAAEDVPPVPQRGHLSGADIEGMVGRAWRTSLLAGADHITREALATVVEQFMPSTQGLERELQETAAILECTDRQFLPAAIVEKTTANGGRAALQERLTALKQLVREL